MQLKCVVIDDEPLAISILEKYISGIPSLQLVQSFDDAISGGDYLRNHPADLLFVDINMPDITGIDLLRSLPVRPMVIFTTAYKKFAYEGFELDAIDYLLKPIDFERFTRAVNKAIAFAKTRNPVDDAAPKTLFVRSEYRMVQVPLDDIEYIEGLEDYIKIHLSGGRPLLTLMTLKAVTEKLPPSKFRRIHRSYIVPLNKIKSVLNRKVLLTSEVELPLSQGYSEELNAWMKQ